jgi:putative addiction module component (TIGR02574 family)
MTPAADELYEAVSRLSAEDRAELAARLLDGLDADADPGADAAWDEEIRTRVEDVRAGRVAPVPWPDTRAQILVEEGGSGL